MFGVCCVICCLLWWVVNWHEVEGMHRICIIVCDVWCVLCSMMVVIVGCWLARGRRQKECLLCVFIVMFGVCV